MTTKTLNRQDGQRHGRAHFGSALFTARTAKQWSQEYLGLEMGVSQAAVAAWESGANIPSNEVVYRLETRLGVRAGYLSQHLGFLPLGASRPARLGVVEAILREERLTEDSKRILLATFNAMMAHRD